MVGKTHLAAGITVGAAICFLEGLSLLPGAICLTGAGLGSLLPDIDHKNSTINKVAKPVGVVVNTVVGHRTILHDPVLYGVIGVCLALLRPEWLIIAVPILLGVASHLLLDALNPSGVPILYLFHGPKLRLASIRTGTQGDTVIRFVLAWFGRCLVLGWLVKEILPIFMDTFPG